MSETSHKTANSLLWSGIENASLAIISLGALVVYSRLLSASEFGLFSIVSAIAELLSILASMLFHDALVQRVEVSDLHFDTAFTVGGIISVGLLAICWGAAPYFESLVNQPGSGNVLALTGLMFPCLAASATIVARQRRQFAFKVLALRSMVGRVLGGIAGIAAAVLGAGVWSLVLQQVVTALVGSLVLWLTCDQRPKFRFRAKEFYELVAFGLFSVSSLFLSFSTKRIFTIFAGLLLGIATAGYLNLAFRTVDVLWAISATAVSQVSLPMLSALQSEPDRLRRVYQKSVEFACLLLYPIFAGIAVTSPEIVQIVFGQQWAAVSPYVAALAYLVLAQAPRLFVTPVLTAVGRPRDPLIGVGGELTFMLVALAIFGLPSLPWAVAVWIASECVQIPISAWVLRRATGFGGQVQFSGIKTPLLATLALVVVVLLTRRFLPSDIEIEPRLALLALVGAATYVSVVSVADRRLLSDFSSFARSAFAKTTH
jgi:O-antigen/teichoic acid export membrane protein